MELPLVFNYREDDETSRASISHICSLSLCFEDINLQDNEELKFILKIVNLVFAVLFTIEMFLKWIAFGLWRYFGSVWTCLDFIIVIVSGCLLAIILTFAHYCQKISDL